MKSFSWNTIDRAITTGKFMLTMIHTEKLFVPPIHQTIVAPPTVRVNDTVRATWPQIAACSGFLAAFGMISV